MYAAVSLGVSSLTDRKAFAAGAVLLLLLVTGAITGALVDGLDAPEWLLAFNLAVVAVRAGAAHLRRARRARRHVRPRCSFAVNLGWIVTGLRRAVVAATGAWW